METKTVLATDHKKSLKLVPQEMAVYKQAKIVGAIGNDHHYYYLFFYKNHYITGLKANEVKLHSHLHYAFTAGILFSGVHPVTRKLLETLPSYSFTRLNQLHNKLYKHFTPKESALITTFIDAFYPKEAIIKVIKEIFYSYRRNGKMFPAYQVLMTLRDFDPANSFAKDLLGSLDFQSFHNHYNDLDKLASRDALYLEKICFTNRHSQKHFTYLMQLYETENRPLDQFAISMSVLCKSLPQEYLFKLQKLILTQFETEDQTHLLDELVQKGSNLSPLTEELITFFCKQNKHTQLVRLLITHPCTPNADQYASVVQSFLKAELNTFRPLFQLLNKRLIQLFKQDPATLEKIVVRCVCAFFNTHELPQITKWLTTFEKEGIQLSIKQKLKKMQLLLEDPDHQYDLGELYIYFHQFDKSIDCFKWEMELNPADPRPVQRLSKVYQQIGKREEAAAYQHLLLQLQK